MKPLLQSQAKNTAFSRNVTFEFRGKSITKTGPLVMGIINLTPDSFYADSRVLNNEKLISTAKEMLESGADILDLGAVSTRPGAIEVSQKEELIRLLPAVELLSKTFPQAILSVDTSSSVIAAKALESGATIINDVSGGKFDPQMPAFIGENNIPYIMMHIAGNPSTMQQNPLNLNALMEVNSFFKHQIKYFEKRGARQLILDPGFGFGKTVQANYQLLAQLSCFTAFNYPVLVGISRKSMIYKVLNVNIENALNGTTALHTIALMNGAQILRVHDVREAKETITLCSMIAESDSKKNSD